MYRNFIHSVWYRDLRCRRQMKLIIVYVRHSMISSDFRNEERIVSVTEFELLLERVQFERGNRGGTRSELVDLLGGGNLPLFYTRFNMLNLIFSFGLRRVCLRKIKQEECGFKPRSSLGIVAIYHYYIFKDCGKLPLFY